MATKPKTATFGGKTVTHGKSASTFGGNTSVRMPTPAPTARINVPKSQCKVCPGANRGR